MDKECWVCPLCSCRAYQKYGGHLELVENLDTGEKKYRKMGEHFMCKGCTVHFSNPRSFNDSNVRELRNNNINKDIVTWEENLK